MSGEASHVWRTKSYVSVMSDIISEWTAELNKTPMPVEDDMEESDEVYAAPSHLSVWSTKSFVWNTKS
jgi:hypothetical protein